MDMKLELVPILGRQDDARRRPRGRRMPSQLLDLQHHPGRPDRPGTAASGDLDTLLGRRMSSANLRHLSLCVGQSDALHDR